MPADASAASWLAEVEAALSPNGEAGGAGLGQPRAATIERGRT
jgi:hypothetical protein